MSAGRNQAASSRCASPTAARPGEIRDRARDPQQPFGAATTGPLQVGELDDATLASPRSRRHASRSARPRQPAVERAARTSERDAPVPPRSVPRRPPSPPARGRARAPAARPAASRSTGRSGRATDRRSVAGSARGRATGSRTPDPSCPANPHGHGFIAATSWNRAGKIVARPTRETATLPSSIGWRSASRTSRPNSGSSSRNRTPWSARVISPGDMFGPPPTIAGVRDGVMRRPERRPSPELGDRTLAGGRRDDGRRQRRGIVERRQEPGDRPRQQRLARSRRPDEQQAVAAGQRDLEPAPRLDLAANLAQVRTGDRRGPATPAAAPSPPALAGRLDQLDPSRRRRATRRRSSRPDDLHRIEQRLDADHLDPVDEPRLVDRGGRDHDPSQAAPRQDGDHRQDARHGPHLAAERQLADQRQAPGTRRDLLRAEQDPHRHREVERRAGLALVGRGEVDRDPARRMDEPGVAQRAPDPLAGLLERGVGQSDDREPGQTRRDVHLDPDEPAVEAVERCGRDDGQHAPNPRRGRSPPGQPRLTPGLSEAPDEAGVSGSGPSPRPRPACRRPARSGAATRRAPNRPW